MTSNSSNCLVVESKYPKIDIPLVTISRFLIEKLRFYGNKTFLIENETKISYTFNEVANDSLRMAHVLSNSGLNEGQHFGICGHNNYEFITTLFGGIIVGGVAVPLNPNTTIDRISNVIKEREIKLLTFATRNQKSLTKETLKKFNRGVKTIVSFNGDLNQESVEDNEEFSEYQSHRKPIASHKCHNESHIGVIKSINSKEKNCLLMETNGSFDPTKAKSCFITDFSLLSQITISSLPVTGFNWTSNDTVLNTTSFAHINGLIQLMCALASGSQFVIFESSLETNIECLYRAIEEWSVSAAIFTPYVIIQMIKEDQLDPTTVRSLKKVICTGASMPKNIGHKFIDKYDIQDFRQAYGMTEICGFATIEPIGSSDYETCGVPVPAVQIKIVDTDSDVVLGATQVGEVCVKSPQLFNGYLSSDQIDNHLSEDKTNGTDGEGWLHTHDIGYYDINRKLQIVDPIDDFILFRGLHISPTSLEAILLSHFAVKEAAIFGSSHSTDGQTPTALVVLKANDNNNSTENVTQMLRQYINDHLIQQNVFVEEIYIVDEIPKTLSGKVNRTDLRCFVDKTIRQLNRCDVNKYLIDL